LHELSIASGIVNSVREAALGHEGVIGVKEVEVRIGAASFVGKDQLEFCFGILSSEDDLLKGAVLKVAEEEVEVFCSSCGRKGPLGMTEDPAFHHLLPVFACPDCGSGVEIIKGRSVTISNVTLLMEDDS